MFRFRQSRKLMARYYRTLIPEKSNKGYDVLDFKLCDINGNKGDLHIHIEKDGTIALWSNSFKLVQDI